MWTAIAVLAVLGLGGQAVEHYFGNIGLPTSSAPTTTFTAPTTLPLHSTTTGPSIAAQDSAFIDLKLIGTAAATKFSFTDQHGHTYGTSQARGKVTLVTFYNKNCNDICPVLGAELHDLLSDLGPQASKINIVIVNTDPFSFGATSEPLALTIPRLNTDTNEHRLEPQRGVEGLRYSGQRGGQRQPGQSQFAHLLHQSRLADLRLRHALRQGEQARTVLAQSLVHRALRSGTQVRDH
jgi:hypothetical protein